MSLIDSSSLFPSLKQEEIQFLENFNYSRNCFKQKVAKFVEFLKIFFSSLFGNPLENEKFSIQFSSDHLAFGKLSGFSDTLSLEKVEKLILNAPTFEKLNQSVKLLNYAKKVDYLKAPEDQFHQISSDIEALEENEEMLLPAGYLGEKKGHATLLHIIKTARGFTIRHLNSGKYVRKFHPRYTLSDGRVKYAPVEYKDVCQDELITLVHKLSQLHQRTEECSAEKLYEAFAALSAVKTGRKDLKDPSLWSYPQKGDSCAVRAVKIFLKTASYSEYRLWKLQVQVEHLIFFSRKISGWGDLEVYRKATQEIFKKIKHSHEKMNIPLPSYLNNFEHAVSQMN